jgi:hypothetical protein
MVRDMICVSKLNSGIMLIKRDSTIGIYYLYFNFNLNLERFIRGYYKFMSKEKDSFNGC